MTAFPDTNFLSFQSSVRILVLIGRFTKTLKLVRTDLEPQNTYGLSTSKLDIKAGVASNEGQPFTDVLLKGESQSCNLKHYR